MEYAYSKKKVNQKIDSLVIILQTGLSSLSFFLALAYLWPIFVTF